MFAHQINMMMSACIVLCLIAGCEKPMVAKSNSEEPIQKVTFTVEKRVREDFFDQLRKFADRHAFAIRIAQNTPDGESFVIQMWREDLKVVSTNSFDPTSFSIYAYKNSPLALPPNQLDFLIGDLKRSLGEVRGVILESQKR